MGTFLARWSPADLPRPADRAPAKVRDWVDAVFAKRRFYAEPDIGRGREVRKAWGRGVGRGRAGVSAVSHHPLSLHTSLSQPPPAASTSAGDVPGHLSAPAVSRAPSDAGALIGGWGDEPAAAPAVAGGGWAAFDSPPPPAPALAVEPPADGGWATFDAAAAGPVPAAATPTPAPAAPAWASFDAPPPPDPAPATSTGSAAWASFDAVGPATPQSAPSGVAAGSPSARAALPDLFSETPTPAPLPAALSSTPASPPPAAASPGVSGGGSTAAGDPFGSLAPALRSALPSPNGSGQQTWGGTAAAASPGVPAWPGAATSPGATAAADAGSVGPKPKSGNPFA